MSSDVPSSAITSTNRLAVVSVRESNKQDNLRKRKIKVLDEDTYIQNVEKIITRDFFPDLEKLQAQGEYIDAVERKDTDKLYEICRRYSTRVHTGRTSPVRRLTTPSTFETPSGSVKATPTAAESVDHTDAAAGDVEVESCADADDLPTHNPEPKDALRNVGLDEFLSKNTSEDNVSFCEIMNESEKKKRLKNSWLYEAEQQQQLERSETLALPVIEQQAIASTSKNLQTWTYVAKNALMYPPQGVTESEREKIERASKKPREITHKNTRFTADPFNDVQSKQTLTQAASSQALLLHGKIGADGREILPTNTPTLRGYRFIATPSPAPGVDASPLMTWGEIEGTPFSLEPGDTPLMNRTPGPVFKVPDVPKRDRLLLELAERASKAHRAKKQEAIKQCQASFSRTASPATPKSDRLAFLSPAAQRLATKKFGIRPTTDKALRDSYTPSPSRRTPGGSVKTPTPSHASTPTPTHTTTPKQLTTPKNKPNRTSLTDDLLQLPARPRAQDLF